MGCCSWLDANLYELEPSQPNTLIKPSQPKCESEYGQFCSAPGSKVVDTGAGQIDQSWCPVNHSPVPPQPNVHIIVFEPKLVAHPQKTCHQIWKKLSTFVASTQACVDFG